MKQYRFEIQSCINVIVEADDEEEARLDIVDHIGRYADQVMQDPYVSEGVEVKMSDYGRVKVIVVLISSGDNMADEAQQDIKSTYRDILVDDDLPMPELLEKFQKAITRIEEGNDEV